MCIYRMYRKCILYGSIANVWLFIVWFEKNSLIPNASIDYILSTKRFEKALL